MAYIYKITNIINDKIYIGKTSQTIEKRWKEHCSDYLRRNEEKRPLYSAMKKYGIQNFKIEEIEQCTSEEANEKEKYWIEYYNSFKNGYNATIGGDGKAYIDRKLVINTYQKIQNCVKTAEIYNIHVTTVYKILEENNIVIKSAQQINREKSGKAILMLDLNNQPIKSFPSLISGAKFLRPDKKNDTVIHGMASHIRDVCNGKRKTAYKYKWAWL